MSAFDALPSLRLIAGLIVSSLIGAIAYRRGALSQTGVLGAIITGSLIFGFGGWVAGLLLIAFFISSSLLSHFRAGDARKQRAAQSFEKGTRRDIWQALANGGAAAGLVVLGWLVQGDGAATDIITAAVVGALAAATADTWATELGILSTTPPRLITRPGTTVAPGTSGGITPIGTLAAVLGGAFIGLCYAAFTWLYRAAVNLPNVGPPLLATVFIATAAGLAGSLFDSFLGATVQAMYYSDKRNKETEKRFELDGTPNRLLRGWPWLNNDWVNFIASLVGAGVAASMTLIVIASR